MLNITTKREGENLLVRLDGPLDRLTAPQLYDTLTANLDGGKNLTLDFEKLNYTSSAGLRVLLATEKEIGKKGRMEIIHVNEMIMDAFEVTGLVDIFNIV